MSACKRPSDWSARQKFITDHLHNYSVIASAGTGKTTAITAKIANIIETNACPLDRLFVVTYTQKAAEELRLRTLRTIYEKDLYCPKFSQIFFGTIHSLANYLLKKFGHKIGIDADFTVETNETQLWNDFLQATPDITFDIPKNFTFLSSGQTLLDLVKEAPLVHFGVNGEENFVDLCSMLPKVDFSCLLNFNAKRNANILLFQKNLTRWIQNQNLPFPTLQTSARKFNSLYRQVLGPIRTQYATFIKQKFNFIAQCYRHFRLKQKRLLFDDLIQLTIQITVPEDRNLHNFYIILDEAQDTDPNQFTLLLNLAKTSIQDEFPGNGHFNMVGDPQQSIYSERADVEFYQNLHKNLIKDDHAESLIFSVTMRFSPQIATNLNILFPSLLDGQNGQIAFNKITSLKESGNNRLWFCLSVDHSNANTDLLALSDLFNEHQPQDFGVQHWNEIAILCPRRSWLEEIQQFLASFENLPKTQLLSTSQTYRQIKAFCWLHGLIKFLLNPNNALELVGLLRECFKIPDSEIAHYFSLIKHSQNNPFLSNHQNSSNEDICNRFPSIQQAQKCLKTLCEKIINKSPVEAALLLQNWITERLDSISTNFEQIDSHFWETIISLAASCRSLFEFSTQLKALSQQPLPEKSIDQNAIQLYTFHKAKGLEWPVVILPFINREPYPAPKKFPFVYREKLLLDRQDFAEQVGPDPELHNQQRLLYVALTRQKNYTIFVDNGETPKQHSLKGLLCNAASNALFFKQLPGFKHKSSTDFLQTI